MAGLVPPLTDSYIRDKRRFLFPRTFSPAYELALSSLTSNVIPVLAQLLCRAGTIFSVLAITAQVRCCTLFHL